MANHILAVHLDGAELSLAIAESTLRSLRITTLARAAFGSHMLTDILTSRRWDRIIASLPGQSAFFRILEFPFHDRRRLAQAVGPALEEHVPASLDDSTVIFDFTASHRRSAVLATMLADDAIRDHRQRLEDAAITPGRLLWAPTVVLEAYRRALGSDADFTAIDLDHEGATVACLESGRVTGLRVLAKAPDDVLLRNIVWSLRTLDPASDRVVIGGARALELHPGIAETLGSSRIEPLPEPCPVKIDASNTSWRRATTAVGLVLAAGADVEPPLIEVASLRPTGDRTRSELGEATRLLAPWAVLTLVLALTAGAFDYARLSRSRAALEAQAQSIFTRVMPAGSRGPGQLIKMQLRLRELERRQSEIVGSGPAASPLSVLAEMSAALPAALDIEFDNYAYDPPMVRLHGQGKSFEAVTRVQQALETSSHFGDIEVSNVRSSVSGDSVEFQLSLRLSGENNPA